MVLRAAFVAMMRMMERWETLAAERAKRVEARDDEDLAAVLERTNDRIVELAEELAGQMVAARADPGPRKAAVRRVGRRRAAGAVSGRT